MTDLEKYESITERNRLTAEVAALRARVTELESELDLRRKPLDYPGDEEAVRLLGGHIPYCTCVGRASDDAHRERCAFWKHILRARKVWRDKHVLAWSCSLEGTRDGRCEYWCGHQSSCTATTRDEIDLTVANARRGLGREDPCAPSGEPK